MAVAAHTRPLRRRALGMVLVLAVVAALSGCELATPTGPGPMRYRDDVFAAVTRTNGITYGQAVDQLGQTKVLALDLYEPTGDTLAARPLVIWVHGGSFRSGTRGSPELVDQATYLGTKGFVSASITYRLSPNGCTSISAECVTAMGHAAEDARAAVRFFRANAATYRIDPERIAIAGTSAGAITALNLAFGIGSEGTSGSPGFSSAVRSAVSLSGAIYFTQYVDPTDAPTLMFHGTADPLVGFSLAKATRDAALADGLVSYVVAFEGDGHVPYAEHRDQILEVERNFLFHTLDLG